MRTITICIDFSLALISFLCQMFISLSINRFLSAHRSILDILFLNIIPGNFLAHNLRIQREKLRDAAALIAAAETKPSSPEKMEEGKAGTGVRRGSVIDSIQQLLSDDTADQGWALHII